MSVVGILGLIPSSRDGWMIASIIIATDAVTVVMIAGLSRISKRLDNNKAFIYPFFAIDPMGWVKSI